MMEYFSFTRSGEVINCVVVLFGAWRTKPFIYKPLLRHFNKQGIQVLFYQPKPELIGVDVPYQTIVNATAEVVKHVSEELGKNAKKPVVIAFGISFGTIFATEIAKRISAVSKLILVAPYGDFEKHVIRWSSQKPYDKIVHSQPTNILDSGRIMNTVGVIKNLRLLKGKQILICYASGDNITHYEISKDLPDRLTKLNISNSQIVTRGGHIYGILKIMLLNQRKLDKFIKS